MFFLCDYVCISDDQPGPAVTLHQPESGIVFQATIPDRANAAFKGECDQENSPLSLPRWTPCLFLFIFLFFLVCFLSYFPMLSTFYCLYLEKKKKKKRNYSICLSLALCLYLLFWFVVLIIVQPPTPLSLFCYSCSLCVIEFCPGCYGIPVGCVSHMG